MVMMIPKKRVSSGNCLHLRLELDSTNNGFERAQRLPSPGRNKSRGQEGTVGGCTGALRG